MTSERPKTIHAFTWARALGAVAIVLLHALTTVQIAGGNDALGRTRVLAESCVTLALTRWAVPVFFMMSGALMLDPARNVTWRKIGKHVWRMVFVLLTFGLAFCLIERVMDTGAFSLQVVGNALLDVACARSWDHLWFVYALIGFYLLTPVLRPFVAQASRRELLWTVAFMVLTLQGANTLRTIVDVDLWQVIHLPVNLTWYVLGYVAHTYLRFDRRVAAAGAVSLALMLLLRIVFDLYWVGLPEHIFVVPLSLAVFLAFERYLEVPTDGHPLVGLLADYSFGIYLVHPLFQHAIVELIDVATWPAVAIDALMVVVPLAASLALVWILRKIPVFSDKL